MRLTDTVIRAAKPKAKPYKLADGAGMYLMYLEVAPSGGKWWRLKYRIDGKEKRISLGTYPETGLKEARELRNEARKLLTMSIDPSGNRKAKKASRQAQTEGTFEVIVREWFAENAPNWVATHAVKIIRRLERDIFPWLGTKHIAAITPPELLSALRRIKDRGALDTAHRAQQNCSQIFRYAVATGRVSRDIVPGFARSFATGQSYPSCSHH